MGKLNSSSLNDFINSVKSIIISKKFPLSKFASILPLEDYWITRILASGLDLALMLLVTGLVSDMILVNSSISLLSFILILGVVSFVYSVVAESLFGFTIGKILFKLRITNVDGTKPFFKEVIIRNISKVFFVFLILDMVVTCFISKRFHQRYLDTFAHTTVRLDNAFNSTL